MEQYESEEKKKIYPKQGEKVVEAIGDYKHVMALTLDPRTGNKEGIVRCIASREGNVDTYGYVDRSELHRLHSDVDGRFIIGEKLVFSGEATIVSTIAKKLGDDADWEYLGNEDPDIWIDNETGFLHLYFTMPFRNVKEDKMSISLGHAFGKDLDSLAMTEPVILDVASSSTGDELMGVAKELSIAPKNAHGSRFNLVESADKRNGIWYSVVRKVEAENMGQGWDMQEVLFHPAEGEIAWAGEHASPGPLMSQSFLDIGKGKLVGFLNGREASDRSGEAVKYGKFSVGLFIYNYENGNIEWVSPEPFIFDSEATTITFASQFVEKGNGKGILYAHVDDSFIRSYNVDAESIKRLLPEEYAEPKFEPPQ
jgi:hypothetical protein